jgi:hypothetical protein
MVIFACVLASTFSLAFCFGIEIAGYIKEFSLAHRGTFGDRRHPFSKMESLNGSMGERYRNLARNPTSGAYAESRVACTLA